MRSPRPGQYCRDRGSALDRSDVRRADRRSAPELELRAAFADPGRPNLRIASGPPVAIGSGHGSTYSVACIPTVVGMAGVAHDGLGPLVHRDPHGMRGSFSTSRTASVKRTATRSWEARVELCNKC